MLMRLIVLVGLFLTQTAFAKEYIIKYKNSGPVTLSGIQGLSVLDTHQKAQLTKVSIKGTAEEEANLLAQLSSNKQIEYIVPNFKLEAFRAPVDMNKLRDQWSIVKVEAEKAWQIAGNRGSRNVLVAVIDTGVDYRHESLAPNMVPGYDFKDKDNDPMDDTGAQNPGHGTHCAGAVAATGLIDGGIVGLSPEVSMMPIRFLGADGGGDLMDGIRSIDYAIEKGAHVISASWGATVSESQAQPLIEAVKRADDAGVIFVAAAANDGRNNDSTSVYPANAGFPNTITVAASGANDQKPSWSNFGIARVHVAAPGENIMSTLPKNKYGNLSGTSMATPLVSGLVALLLAQNPELTGREVRALLQATGAKTAIQVACQCRVDAAAAVQAVVGREPTVVPYNDTIALEASVPLKLLFATKEATFTSENTAVAIVEGTQLKAIKEGETRIIATVDGQNYTSGVIRVGMPSGGGGGGGDGECPFGDPMICELICQFEPSLPFCN